MSSAERMSSAENEAAPPLVPSEIEREIGLGHLAGLLKLVELREAERRQKDAAPPRTSSERHMALHGHRLTFGCCREDVTRMEAA